MERNEHPILTSAEKRERFLAVRKEFGQVMFFLIFLGAGFLYFSKDYRRQKLQIICEAENTAMHFGKLHFEQNGYMFAGGEYQSDEVVHNGKYSMKLEPTHPYGFQVEHEGLWGSEEVIARVWRYSAQSDGKHAGLVAEVRGIVYELQKESIRTSDKGWELLELRFSLDCLTENRSLRVYCWNPTQADVYFDDLNIQINREGVF